METVPLKVKTISLATGSTETKPRVSKMVPVKEDEWTVTLRDVRVLHWPSRQATWVPAGWPSVMQNAAA